MEVKLKQRNKLIKMVDRSTIGWETVVKYEADPVASDSRCGKKIRGTEKKVLSK